MDMNYKRLSIGLGMMVLAFVGTGCTALSNPDVASRSGAAFGSEAKDEENGRRMLEAFIRNDPDGFIGVLPGELEKQFGKKEFDNARAALVESLGEPISYRFETRLEHPAFDVSLWKVRFERRGTDGKIIHQEALFRVISGTLDGKFRIISFNFL
jgi:hypothetical protein